MNFSTDESELAHASSLYQRRRYADCLKVLLALVIKCDTGASIMLWAGNCLAQMGQNALALRFFQRCMEVTQTQQSKVLALENSVKVLFNEQKLEAAAWYAQQLKELQPSNFVAAVADSEYRLQSFLVNRATLLYLEGVLLDNAGSAGYAYVQYQLCRVCIMLGQRERGFEGLGELALKEERLGSYCYQYPGVYMSALRHRLQQRSSQEPSVEKMLEEHDGLRGTLILPQATESLYSLALGASSVEMVERCGKLPQGFLAGLFWAVDRRGQALRSEQQVLESLKALRERFSYLLKDSTAPWLYQLVTQASKDRVLGITLEGAAPAFHNAALLVKNQELRTQLLLAALWLWSDRMVSATELVEIQEALRRAESPGNLQVAESLLSPREDNCETLLALGQEMSCWMLPQNVYVAQLGLEVSRDHTAAVMGPQTPLQLLLRRKTYMEFATSQSGQMLMLLGSQLKLDADFETLAKIAEDSKQLHLFADGWALLLQAQYHCKKLAYVSAQRWLSQAAGSLQTSYALRDEKISARLRLKAQEEADRVHNLLYKGFKSAGRSSILLANFLFLLATCLLAEQNVDPDQYGFALGLYSQVISACPPELQERLSQAMGLLAVKQRRYDDAARFCQRVPDSPSGVVLKLKVCVELGLKEEARQLVDRTLKDAVEMTREFPGMVTALWQANEKLCLGVADLSVPPTLFLSDGEEQRLKPGVQYEKRGRLEDEILRHSFGPGPK